MYFVYIIECTDKTLYTGLTTDVKRRFNEHKKGIGARYTKMKGVRRVIYTEPQPDRSSATIRENQIKKMTRQAKLRLVH